MNEFWVDMLVRAVCVGAPLFAFGGACLLAYLQAWLKERRERMQSCQGCGYDLRFLPPRTTNCPECGRELGKVTR
jgi:hypothetical protein